MTEQELLDIVCFRVISSDVPSFGGVSLFKLLSDLDDSDKRNHFDFINDIRVIYYKSAFFNQNKQFRTDLIYKESFCKEIKNFVSERNLTCPDVILNFELLK